MATDQNDMRSRWALGRVDGVARSWVVDGVIKGQVRIRVVLCQGSTYHGYPWLPMVTMVTMVAPCILQWRRLVLANALCEGVHEAPRP